MPDIFDEVEEDLRAERARALGRRYWGADRGRLLLILVGTGGYVFWQQRSTAAANAVADRFITAAGWPTGALSTRGGPQPRPPRRAATLSRASPRPGRPATACSPRLRLAALQWQTGQHDRPIATWQSLVRTTPPHPPCCATWPP